MPSSGLGMGLLKEKHPNFSPWILNFIYVCIYIYILISCSASY